MNIVFPTHVGMVRRAGSLGSLRPGFPHACGDGPKSRMARSCSRWFSHACGDGPELVSRAGVVDRFSPRMWGWSAIGVFKCLVQVVFPTHVGMVRCRSSFFLPGRGFPHACGDGPNANSSSHTFAEFSPRMWGWSERQPPAKAHHRVFPTHVGMVRCYMHAYLAVVGW